MEQRLGLGPVDEAELVRSIYARWARGDSAGDLFHEDIDWSMPHPGGQVHGRSATLSFLADFIGTWVEHEMEVEELRAVGGGRVLVLFTERARGVVSGVPTEAHPAAVFTVSDGLVTRFHAFGDRDEALASLDSYPSSWETGP